MSLTYIGSYIEQEIKIQSLLIIWQVLGMLQIQMWAFIKSLRILKNLFAVFERTDLLVA